MQQVSWRPAPWPGAGKTWRTGTFPRCDDCRADIETRLRRVRAGTRERISGVFVGPCVFLRVIGDCSARYLGPGPFAHLLLDRTTQGFGHLPHVMKGVRQLRGDLMRFAVCLVVRP